MVKSAILGFPVLFGCGQLSVQLHGCGQADLQGTGGNGFYYCFAIDANEQVTFHEE